MNERNLHIRCNNMINIIDETIDIISKYEDEGYLENDNKILMVSENKFYFRDKNSNEIEIIEYFDRQTNMKDDIKMKECLDKAYEYSLFINKF